MEEQKNYLTGRPKLLWQYLGPESKIKLINGSHFENHKVVNMLGLGGGPLASSFGITDRDEIISRSETLKILMENESLRGFIQKLSLEASIPIDGSVFLQQFNIKHEKQSLFATQVEQVIVEFEKISDDVARTGRLKDFVTHLKASINELRDRENKFGELVGIEILRSSYLQGVVNVELKMSSHSIDNPSCNNDKSEMYGYKKYSYKREKIKKPSSWSRFRWWCYQYLLPWNYFIIKRYNSNTVRLSNTPQLIDRNQDCVFLDIEEAVHEIINSLYAKQVPNGKGIPGTSIVRSDFAKRIMKIIYDSKSGESISLNMNVMFVYDDSGLKIRFGELQALSPSLSSHSKYDLAKITGFEIDFPGYTQKQVDDLKEKIVFSYENNYKRSEDLQAIYVLHEALAKKNPDLYTDYRHTARWKHVSSDMTDKEFKFYSVSQICNLDSIKDLYNAVVSHRNYISHQMNILKDIAGVADTLLDNEKVHGMKLHFPEILQDNHHLVAFDSMVPVHIIGRKVISEGKEKCLKSSDLVPIRGMAPLNGQMAVVTGSNGGGKSVTLNELIYDIYLAQSGLPVFAEGFKLNVKETIGIVVVNGSGENSLMQDLQIKIKNVIEESMKSDPSKTIVLMDELLSGTQESAGLELGEMVLRKLSKIGCSVMFNTQITQLAQFAESQLGAKTYKFNNKNQISEGIGLGEAKLLAKKTGLLELLQS